MCREHSRDFYFAVVLPAPRKREAVYAVAAFCQMIAEAIDVPLDAPLVGSAVRRTHPAISLPQIEEQKATGGCSLDQLETRLELLSDRLDEIYEDRLEMPALESRFAATACLGRVRARRGSSRLIAVLLDFAHGCRMDLTVKRTPIGRRWRITVITSPALSD